MTETAAAASRLRVTRVNPLEHEMSLKAFMTAHGYLTFEHFFNRGYQALVADGGASWVGFDDAGCIQISLTQFVHRFRFRGVPVRAGFIGNVMAAHHYRTFFPAFALFRRMLLDTQDRREIDFVYGDPTPQAVAISRAAKMEHVGNLDRLVLPIADPNVVKHVGARLFARAPFILGGRVAPDLHCYSAATGNLEVFDQPSGPEDCVIACHSASMLHRRLQGFPGSNDFVAELRWDRHATDWDALVLLRLDDGKRILSILSVRRRSDVSWRAVLPTLVPLARRIGAHRLQVETLLGSNMANEFRSLGFRPRGDILPIFVKGFSPAGHEMIRNLSHWEVTELDMER